jgi:hypothetical protein
VESLSRGDLELFTWALVLILAGCIAAGLSVVHRLWGKQGLWALAAACATIGLAVSQPPLPGEPFFERTLVTISAGDSGVALNATSAVGGILLAAWTLARLHRSPRRRRFAPFAAALVCFVGLTALWTSIRYRM